MKNQVAPASKTGEASLTAEETNLLASTLRASLSVEEILRSCYRALSPRLPLNRLCLVPLRPNEFTVTVYTVEGSASDPSVSSRIINLVDSRLRRCLIDGNEQVVHFRHPSERDQTEEQFLLTPNAHTAAYMRLVQQGVLNGVLVLDVAEGAPLDTARTAFLRLVVEHLSFALENSDVCYAERRQGRQLQMISEIAKQAVRLKNLEEFLNSVSALIRNEFDHQLVQLWTPGAAQDHLQLRGCAYKSLNNDVFPSPTPMVDECRRKDAILRNNNALADPVWQPAFNVTASQLAIPVQLRGKFLGVLYVENSRLNAFPDEDLNIMEAVASLIASAFDQLRALEYAQQSNEYMQALLQSVKDLAILSTDIHGYVMTSSAGSQAILLTQHPSVLGKDLLTLFTNPKFQQEVARYMGMQDLPTLERKRVPQETAEGQRYLDVTLQRVYDPGKRPLGFLCIARNVTENVRLHEELEALTMMDELTGLYNQRSFFSTLATEIERSRRIKRSLCLIFFDLDWFKKFNDTHGHLLGSQVLRETAQLLLGKVRANSDSCYRYGGDEFIVIMPETQSKTAALVAERRREGLYERFQQQISASVGIAEYSENLDPKTLLVKADQAMYAAKQKGGNCIVVAD